MYSIFNNNLSHDGSPNLLPSDPGRELLLRAAAVRTALPETTTGACWLLAVDSPSDFAAALLAIWDAGCTAMLSADTRPGTLQELSPRVVGVISDNASLSISAPIVSFPFPTSAAPLCPGSFEPDAIALQLFTSGSTGARKVVSKTFRQLFEEVHTLDTQWGQDTARLPRLTTVSHLHIYGFLFNILWPVVKGCPLPRTRSLYWEEILATAADTGAVIISSPPHLRFLADIAPNLPFNWSASLIFSSGGPLSEEIALRIASVTGIVPIEVYGSTETGGVGFRCRNRDESTAFTPLPGVRLRTDPGGQLELRSPWQWDDSWTPTGDRACMMAENQFDLLGRVDTIVKVAGKRVSLTEMMTLINTATNVLESRIFPLSEEGGTARSALGAAICVTREQSAILQSDHSARTAAIADLRRILETRFDASVLPRRWRFVEDWPVDDRGKVSTESLQKLVTGD